VARDAIGLGNLVGCEPVRQLTDAMPGTAAFEVVCIINANEKSHFIHLDMRNFVGSI
jgi:hypothetical protein